MAAADIRVGAIRHHPTAISPQYGGARIPALKVEADRWVAVDRWAEVADRWAEADRWAAGVDRGAEDRPIRFKHSGRLPDLCVSDASSFELGSFAAGGERLAAQPRLGAAPPRPAPPRPAPPPASPA